VSKSYCGYHTASTSIVQGYNIKYAFSPDPPAPNYNGCSGNVSTFGDTTSPNGDIGADSVTDTLMHEISEAATDPNLNAWYTQNGYENGDLCNFVYGTTYTAPNGSHANHLLGNRNYLVQTIWQNTGKGFCSLSFP
jgi:Phosphate-induced protein 1 conserved region